MLTNQNRSHQRLGIISNIRGETDLKVLNMRSVYTSNHTRADVRQSVIEERQRREDIYTHNIGKQASKQAGRQT